MSTGSRRGRPTRREAEEIERRLVEAALEAFLDNGYDATTMEAIADRAKISKRTLYARYPDKRAVFLAVIPPALADMPKIAQLPDVPSDDLPTALRTIAHAVVAGVVDPRGVRLRRLAVAEVDRLPELGYRSNLAFWAPTMRRVVDLLEIHRERGAIDVDDVVLAADHFMVLVAGGPTALSDFGFLWPPDEQRRHTEFAVDLFLHGVLSR